MIGTGIGLGVSGFVMNNGLRPLLDLYFSQEKSLTALAGPTPSYSRASKGWAFNASGVLTEHAIDAPRFDHVYNGSAWVSRGLLIEEQRTNLILRSAEFDNASWSKTASSVSADAVVSPAATTTADKLNEDTSTAFHFISQLEATTTGITYTLSVFAKAGERSILGIQQQNSGGSGYGYVNFDLSAGLVLSAGNGLTTANGSILDVGSGWYRCSITFAADATGVRQSVFLVRSTDNHAAYLGTTGYGLYLWGAQLEAGALTSHIPTTSGSVVRSADVCQITGTSFSNIWNAAEGSLVIDADCNASGTAGILSANDATADERIELYCSGTDPRIVVVDGGVTQADIDAGSVAARTVFKMAARYKVNDFAVSEDGAAVVTDTGGTIPTPTLLDIGKNQAGNYLNGHIARVRLYNAITPDATLQSLST